MMGYDVQYHDVIFFLCITIIWTAEIVRRLNPKALVPTQLQHFFRESMRLTYGNNGKCTLTVSKAGTKLTMGNVYDLLSYPSVVVTRQTVVTAYTALAVLLCQYSYVLQHRLDPKSMLWIVFYAPIQLFFNISIGASGSLMGSHKTGPGASQSLAPWFSYGIRSFLVVLSFCAGLLVVRLAFSELESRLWYIACAVLYAFSLFGLYLIEVISPRNLFVSQTSSAEMLSMFLGNEYYIAFSRFEGFVHMVTSLCMVGFLFGSLAHNKKQHVAYTPYFLFLSLSFAFISNSISFAKSNRSMAAVRAYIGNTLVIVFFMLSVFGVSNSICAFDAIPCQTTISASRAGSLSYQILTFLPLQIIFLIAGIGAITSTAAPKATVKCDAEFDEEHSNDDAY